MAINLVTKYSDKVLERFKRKSYTVGIASNNWSFDGIKALKIFSVGTSPLVDYTRGSGTSRYGTVKDLEDTTQTLTMTQDKAFTYSIDKGDEKEQLNIKSANRSLQREIDMVVTPHLDKYNFEKWCIGAGSHITDGGTAVNKNSITEYVMDCTETLDEAAAPEDGRTLFVTNKYYKILKQNPDFLENSEKLAEAALVRGEVGRIDNMRVVKVPNSYLPAGVMWMIVSGVAVLAPMKLKEYKIHKDPMGVSGDVVEGRIMHDAFVLGEYANAVCLMLNNSYYTAAPNYTNDATNSVLKIAAATGTKVWYTIDGSDPANSDTTCKATGNAINVSFDDLNNSTKVVRAIAVPTDNACFHSDVKEYEY